MQSISLVQFVSFRFALFPIICYETRVDVVRRRRAMLRNAVADRHLRARADIVFERAAGEHVAVVTGRDAREVRASADAGLLVHARGRGHAREPPPPRARERPHGDPPGTQFMEGWKAARTPPHQW